MRAAASGPTTTVASRPFLDTNVLVYAFSAVEPRKDAAARLIAAGGVISVQVLNEFVNVARGKLKRDWDVIAAALDDLGTALEPALPLTLDVHRRAIDLARHHGFSIYDSLIVASATLAGCRTLYTEDLQDGRVIGGLTILNPFATGAA